MRKVNYLNNKDLLKQIHKSKSGFCSFIDTDYHQFDIILLDVDKINIFVRFQVKILKNIGFRPL